ncbi:MAG: hypothetical protein IIC66_04900 [candidate division Zixibacteria bacterium]|nr:hypothetical protein [candidate division Zixibacteria bacterium]
MAFKMENSRCFFIKARTRIKGSRIIVAQNEKMITFKQDVILTQLFEYLKFTAVSFKPGERCENY